MDMLEKIRFCPIKPIVASTVVYLPVDSEELVFVQSIVRIRLAFLSLDPYVNKFFNQLGSRSARDSIPVAAHSSQSGGFGWDDGKLVEHRGG
jgi:hypothetical protein